MCLHISNRYGLEKLQRIHNNMFSYQIDFIYMSTSDIANRIGLVGLLLVGNI